jgi:hypothetical protein
MNCPLKNTETADLLLDYCNRKLGPESMAIFEQHIEICPACREFADGQRAVWSALDAWEASPVSADFDARLYERLDGGTSWRGRLFGSLRPMFAYRGALAAAAACLLLVVGVWLERPGKPVVPAAPPDTAVLDVAPEQLEKAMDAMDVLSEFNRKSRPENPESKL